MLTFNHHTSLHSFVLVPCRSVPERMRKQHVPLPQDQSHNNSRDPIVWPMTHPNQTGYDNIPHLSMHFRTCLLLTTTIHKQMLRIARTKLCYDPMQKFVVRTLNVIAEVIWQTGNPCPCLPRTLQARVQQFIYPNGPEIHLKTSHCHRPIPLLHPLLHHHHLWFSFTDRIETRSLMSIEHHLAGAVFGEVGVSLFVAGAAFGDILGDSRNAKCCIFQYKIVFKIGRVRSPKRRVRDAILWSDCVRNVVESSFYWRKQFTEFLLKSCTYRFRGRRSIWWGWRLIMLVPRIVNDVSCVTRINHKIHFAWQAQYLVTLEDMTRINHKMHFAWQAQYLVNLPCDFCWSAHCKCRFICDADQSWDSFCVAGALFGKFVV